VAAAHAGREAWTTMRASSTDTVLIKVLSACWMAWTKASRSGTRSS
jgi:hypothetical protein